MPKALTVAEAGRKGGLSRSKAKLAAVRKNLEKANKSREKRARSKRA